MIRTVAHTMVAAGLVAFASPADASAQARAGTGAIEGTVQLDRRLRRVADRYAAGAAPARRVQSVPAIAYIVGPIAGAPFPAAAERPSMLQVDTAFVPALVAVPVGGEVDFPNGDEFFHNVFSASEAQSFDLGHYTAGESKAVTFERAGEVRVYCEVHEFMQAAVLVTENPFYAVVDESGNFRIEGIPAGEYTLAIWDVDVGRTEERVRVTEGGTARVEVELRR